MNFRSFHTFFIEECWKRVTGGEKRLKNDKWKSKISKMAWENYQCNHISNISNITTPSLTVQINFENENLLFLLSQFSYFPFLILDWSINRQWYFSNMHHKTCSILSYRIVSYCIISYRIAPCHTNKYLTMQNFANKQTTDFPDIEILDECYCNLCIGVSIIDWFLFS